MASNSGRKSGSSGRSSSRNRVVIGAEETTRVRYSQDQPQVDSERRRAPRSSGQRAVTDRPGAKSHKVVSAGRKVAGQKRQERDRRRAEIGRRRALMIAVVVVVCVAIGWGMVALWQAPLFTIDTVNVTGVSHLKREDVLKLAAIPADATLVRLPKSQIISRIQSSPWVSGVEVTRSFPNTLNVAIAERVPTATVDAQAAGQWLVSGDGYWIAPRGKEPTGTLVPIRDVPNLRPAAGQKVASPELTNALAVIAGLSPELRSKTKLVSAASVEKTMLVLKNDIQVFFGPAEEVAKKDLIARSILGREKNIVYINVRITDRPTWRGLNAAN